MILCRPSLLRPLPPPHHLAAPSDLASHPIARASHTRRSAAIVTSCRSVKVASACKRCNLSSVASHLSRRSAGRNPAQPGQDRSSRHTTVFGFSVTVIDLSGTVFAAKRGVVSYRQKPGLSAVVVPWFEGR